MPPIRLFLCLLLATPAAALAQAAAVQAPVRAEAQPFLTSRQVDLYRILPRPPAPDSPTTKQELALLHQVEDTRTPERVAQAKADVDESVFTMFGAILGEAFNPTTTPLATQFFRRLAATEEAIMQPTKQQFGRPRPYIADPTLHPVLSRPTNDSYPSGHTSRSTIMGVVLWNMVPEQRDAIYARMLDYAESRVVGGVHYPSDLVAGRLAGMAVDTVLFTDPSFLAEFNPARAELRHAIGLAP